MLTGAGLPYAIKNDNLTSDGSSLSLSVSRGAFSTAPVINYFTITPSTGCSPLDRHGDVDDDGSRPRQHHGRRRATSPPTGSTTFTVVSTGDIILTAVALVGRDRHGDAQRITLQPPTTPPTPTPAAVDARRHRPDRATARSPSPTSATSSRSTFDKHESTGSTFIVNGNQFTYTAGSTTGTDIVRLTVARRRLRAGDRHVHGHRHRARRPGRSTSFTADPTRGCGASSNIVLSWKTENARTVTIDQVPRPSASRRTARSARRSPARRRSR